MWLTPKITEARKAELEKVCSSWATLAPALKTMSYDDCLHVIKRELKTREHPRPEFIIRPFTRAMRLYKAKLWSDIQKISPGAGAR